MKIVITLEVPNDDPWVVDPPGSIGLYARGAGKQGTADYRRKGALWHRVASNAGKVTAHHYRGTDRCSCGCGAAWPGPCRQYPPPGNPGRPE